MGMSLVLGLLGIAQPVATETSCPPRQPNTFCILRGFKKDVYSVAFSPDGQLIAAASKDKTIRLWKVADGQLVYSLEGHSVVTFSADGKVLASASGDETIKLWEVTTGREIRALTIPDAIYISSVVFSPTDQLLASAVCMRVKPPPNFGCAQGDLIFWNPTTGELVRHISRAHSDNISDLAFSPDGRLLATGSPNRTIGLWQAATGRLVRYIFPAIDVEDLAFSPDGQWVVANSIMAGSVFFIWEVSSGRELRLVRLNVNVNDLAFSPNGQFLAVGEAILRVRDWQIVRRLPMPFERFLDSVAFSPDGQLLAVGEGKWSVPTEGLVRLWYVGDLAKAKQKQD